MPRSYRGSGQGFGNAFRGWFDSATKQMAQEVIQAVEKAVKNGEQLTKHHIETRGTPRSGKEGRIETGLMRDSVDSEMTKETPSEVEGRFGWIQETPYYAKFQEAGTRSIEPMFALSDAAVEVVDDLTRDITRIVKNS